MKIKKLHTAYKQFFLGYRRAHIGIFAASSAFYFFLSLTPLVLLLLSLLPYTPLTQDTLTQFLLFNSPQSFQTLIGDIINEVYAKSVAVMSLSALMLLWSAAKLMSSLSLGISEIYDGFRADHYSRLRMRGVAYTMLLLVFLLLYLSLYVFERHLIGIFEAKVPSFDGVWRDILHLRGLIYISYLTLFTTVLFKTIPHKKLVFYHQLPGAAFSAVVGFLFSKLFSWLIERFNIYSMYGSLSIIIISLLWLYYTMLILFVGAYLNTYVALFPNKKNAYNYQESEPVPIHETDKKQVDKNGK